MKVINKCFAIFHTTATQTLKPGPTLTNLANNSQHKIISAIL